LNHLYSHKNQKPVKTVAVIRYGALGDALIASSIFPGLKEEGYHVTVYTVPLGYEALKHDPHVDRFVVQDVDAIPNQQLGEFWNYIKPKYSRFINLCESLERNLLLMSDNMSFHWPHEMRHKHFNKNYVEFVHDIAGVQMPSRIKFYSTEEERNWARAEKHRIGGKVILWVLSGSAVHKVSPHQDSVIDAVLRTHSDARFVLVGDKNCKTLEMGWEKTPQVHLRSGKWTIRETLAFAQACDLVVGPETGVLNGVALESVEKVVMLSHSSKENLTRDWVNTVSLTPSDTPCFPCHRLHMVQDGFKHCVESENKGVAACQQNISARDIYSAINATFIYNRKAA
jgi:ADP-heptose:LPS heptosyltransferase